MINNKNIRFRLSLCLSVFVAFVVSSCWDRQKIPVVPAPVPVYTLSGTVTDMDSGEPVPGVVVEVFNSSTAYAGYDTTVYDTTDDLGYYEFPDVVSPGFVYFYAWRDSYRVFDKNLVMEWRDDTTDVAIPKAAVAEPYGVTLPEGNALGLVWKDDATLAIFDSWTTTPDGGGADYSFRKIWESTNGGEFVRISDDSVEDNDRMYKALGWDGEHYTAVTDTFSIEIFSDQWELMEGKYYILDPGTQEIVSYLDMPVSSSEVKDISTHDGNVFLASGRMLVRWGLATQDTLVVDDPETDYTGITAEENMIYAYDIDPAKEFLLEMDHDFTTLKTYAVMLDDAPNQKLNISGYLALDGEGRLWTIASGEIYRVTLVGE
ncbi:MAG TPA: hypothetical protein EYM89_06570 [Candidatus Marinimicrobia bacterium]|nr:hypothetical protein [Candidatus Neomarinimicrobiota bacterium]